jgi:hypothetical protein
MVYTPPTISTIATEIRSALGAQLEFDARRLAFSFVERWDNAAVSKRVALVATRPPSTGDQRFDALLAAIVEYLCARDEVLAPQWVDEEDRFLEAWWFMSGMPSLYADAIAHSPISFARRGVFITQDALSYA